MPCLMSHRLRSVEDPLFAECWGLYERAFPAEERRRFDCHAAAMVEREDFFCLRLETGVEFAGIAWYWQTPHFIYVEHLAIHPERRGQGLGHRVLELLCGLGLPVILEIEPVEDDATERRWRFYRSAGFHRLSFHHLQPVYRRGDAPMRLELLSYPHAMTAEEVGGYEGFMCAVVGHYTEENLDSRPSTRYHTAKP